MVKRDSSGFGMPNAQQGLTRDIDNVAKKLYSPMLGFRLDLWYLVYKLPIFIYHSIGLGFCSARVLLKK